jgi:protein required for attachment to host cells
MTKFVLVSDSRRGRVLQLTRDSEAGTSELIELATMVHAGRRMRPSEKFSEPRPGLRQAQRGGPVHGVDDRRDSNMDEHDRQFARDVVERAASAIGNPAGEAVIVAASEHMLGLLRPELSRLLADARVTELPLNISSLTIPQIHDELSKRDLIPERGRAGM